MIYLQMFWLKAKIHNLTSTATGLVKKKQLALA